MQVQVTRHMLSSGDPSSVSMRFIMIVMSRAVSVSFSYDGIGHVVYSVRCRHRGQGGVETVVRRGAGAAE